MDINSHIDAITAACQRYGVKSLWVVGSVARGEASAHSDVDFLVALDDLHKLGVANRYFDLHDFLEQELQSHVDLIEESALSNPYFMTSINHDKKRIYG
jgi:predicted nucleotidyltransferase